MSDNIQKEINREVLQTVDNPLPIDKSDKRKLVAIEWNNKLFYETPYKGYFVDIDGNTLSYRHYFNRFNKTIDYKHKPSSMKYNTDKDGYYTCGLSSLISHKTIFIHKLMMLTFVGECDSKHCVDHIDCNRKNNNIFNLRYITKRLNTQRGRCGTVPSNCKPIYYWLDGVLTIYKSKKEFLLNTDFTHDMFKRNSKGVIHKTSKFTPFDVVSFVKGPTTIEIKVKSKPLESRVEIDEETILKRRAQKYVCGKSYKPSILVDEKI